MFFISFYLSLIWYRAEKSISENVGGLFSVFRIALLSQGNYFKRPKGADYFCVHVIKDIIHISNVLFGNINKMVPIRTVL